MNRRRRRARQPPARQSWALLCAIFALVTVVATSDVGAAPLATPAVHQDRKVELTVEAGVANGVIQAGIPVPLRVMLKSARARTVTVALNSNGPERAVQVDLAPDTPQTLDLAMSWSPWLDVSVRSARGEHLASRSVVISPDADRTAVGVGESLVSKGVPDSVQTVGGIQVASLVPLDDELLSRPAALETLSAVVLDAVDIDRIDETFRDRLREWVWSGGDLVLDVAQRPDLPIVDLKAVGVATPVGAGWVRFGGGSAATGSWSTILEPSPVRSDAFLDGGNFGGPMWMDVGGLVKIDFIPTWLIAIAVFGGALLGGPIGWALLRTRRRRQSLWLMAPGLSIVIAVALLVAGQGVFARSSTTMRASIDSSPWGATGTIASGLKSSKTLELGSGAQLIGSDPEAVLTVSGGIQTVDVQVPRNSFGRVAVTDVSFDEAPRIEVTARSTDTGEAAVTVTNHSRGVLRQVSVAGNGRVRKFTDVAPGASESLPFEMNSKIPVFGAVMPAAQLDVGIGDAPVGQAMTADPALPDSRGLVLVKGYLEHSASGGGLSGSGPIAVRAWATVQPAKAVDGGASLRVEEIGGLSKQQRQVLADMRVNGEVPPDGPQVGGPDGGVGTDQGTGENPESAEYARISSVRGRPAGTCGVSTMTSNLELWDGTGWIPMERVGAVRVDEGLLNLQDQGMEVQDWMLPAIDPGQRIHLRVLNRQTATPLPLIFSCGAFP